MGAPRLLSSAIKLIKVKDPTADGTSAVTSDIVDTLGYEGCLFFTSVGTAAADTSIKAQQDTAAGGGTMADLVGTSVVTGASPSNEDVWIDILHPGERYLRVIVTRTTTTTLGDIWAICYGPTVYPVSNVLSGTITGEAHIAPAQGTA